MPKKTGCHWLQRDSLSRWVGTADRWEWGFGNWSCCCAAPMSKGSRLLLGRGHGPSVTGPCHLIVGARRPQGGTGRHRALLSSRLFSQLWALELAAQPPERGLPLPTSLKSCLRREGGTRPREAWVRDFSHPLGGRFSSPLPGQAVPKLCGQEHTQAWETRVSRLLAASLGCFFSALGMVCREEGRSRSSRLAFSLVGCGQVPSNKSTLLPLHI